MHDAGDPHDVAGHDGVFGVHEHTRQGTVGGGGPERLVHLVDGRLRVATRSVTDPSATAARPRTGSVGRWVGSRRASSRSGYRLRRRSPMCSLGSRSTGSCRALSPVPCKRRRPSQRGSAASRSSTIGSGSCGSTLGGLQRGRDRRAVDGAVAAMAVTAPGPRDGRARDPGRPTRPRRRRARGAVRRASRRPRGRCVHPRRRRVGPRHRPRGLSARRGRQLLDHHGRSGRRCAPAAADEREVPS